MEVVRHDVRTVIIAAVPLSRNSPKALGQREGNKRLVSGGGKTRCVTLYSSLYKSLSKRPNGAKALNCR